MSEKKRRSKRKTKAKFIRYIDYLILGGILFLLVFSPLAFGSVHVWSYCLIVFLVFFLIFFQGVTHIIVPWQKEVKWIKTPFNWVVLALLIYIPLQLVPLPEFLMGWFSPKTHEDKSAVIHFLWMATENETHGEKWMGIAYYFHPLIREWLKLASYIGMFYLVLYNSSSERKIYFLTFGILFTGLFEAVYAISQSMTTTPMIWWWPSRAGQHYYVSGTFIGSNHFAFYLEMTVSLLLGYVIIQNRLIQSTTNGSPKKTITSRFVGWFSVESFKGKKILWLTAGLLMIISLYLSASRGGILSITIAVFVLAFFLGKKKETRGMGWKILLLYMIFVFLIFFSGGGRMVDKFRHVEGLCERLRISDTIIDMLLDYPVYGVGWGNFKHLYPQYSPADYEILQSGYSHNDWLESGAELGLVGWGLLIIALLVYMRRLAGIWMKRRDPLAVGLGAGIIMTVVSVSVHSFFDFSMHVPANPITLAAILGLGYAAVHKKGFGIRETFMYGKSYVQLNLIRRIGFSACHILLFLLMVFLVWKHFHAEWHCPTEWNSTLNLDWNPKPEKIRKAIEINPLNSRYYNKIADYYANLSARNTEDIREYNEKAVQLYKGSIRLNPVSGDIWYKLGKMYTKRFYDPDNYLNWWLPLAERCFEFVVTFDPGDETMLIDVASYWVQRSLMLPETGGDRLSGDKSLPVNQKQGIDKFQQLFKHALRIDPEKLELIVDRIWPYYPSDRIILDIIPENNRTMASRALKYTAGKTR